MKKWLVSLSSALLACSCFSPPTNALAGEGAEQQQSMAPVSPRPPHDLIDGLDNVFREIYATSRKDYLASGGPVLIWNRGALFLVNNGKTTQYDYFPPIFDVYKTLDHITLGICCAVVHNPEHPSDEQLKQLVKFRSAIIAAKPQIEAAGLKKRTMQRELRIIENSMKFIDKIEAGRGCPRAELDTYIRDLQPAIIGNIRDAVAADLTALDAKMKEIRKTLTPDEWERLHVVVCSVHMARQGESHMQYFLRLLAQQDEGRRVVFFEGNAEQQDALNLLGTHELDSDIARVYFNDPDRMHRDLLGSVTAEFLDEHPSQ